MELKVAGCWSPYPKPGEGCSGYLVKHGGTSILLDCGHSVFSLLSQYTDIHSINAVCISHFHPDHYIDLYAFRHLVRGAVYLGTRREPLDVYLPPEPAQDFQYWSSLPELRVHDLTMLPSVTVGSIEVEFYPVSHALPCYAAKLTGAGSSLFYTADTRYDDKVWKAACDVNVLLGEATLLSHQSDTAAVSGHLTTTDLARGANLAGPDLLLATHLWPEYPVSRVEREIKDVYHGNLLIASSGLHITF